MPLTPQDVRNKLFTSVRLRPGYDEDEVDAFLDEIEQELARLLAEIEQLKADRGPSADVQLAAAREDADSRARSALAEVSGRHAQELASLRAAHEQAILGVRAETDAVRREADARLAQAAQQMQAQQQQLHHLQQLVEQAQHQSAVPGVPPGAMGPAAAVLPPPSPTEDALRRTLLLAQRTADEAVAEARAEAHRIVGEAKRHVVETTRRAEAEHGAAMSRARTDYETLAAKVEELRGFERDYRSRLRAYLHLQLRDLEAGAPEPPQSIAAATRTALTDGSGRAGAEGPEATDAADTAEAPEVVGGPGGAGTARPYVGPVPDGAR